MDSFAHPLVLWLYESVKEIPGVKSATEIKDIEKVQEKSKRSETISNVSKDVEMYKISVNFIIKAHVAGQTNFKAKNLIWKLDAFPKLRQTKFKMLSDYF